MVDRCTGNRSGGVWGCLSSSVWFLIRPRLQQLVKILNGEHVLFPKSEIGRLLMAVDRLLFR